MIQEIKCSFVHYSLLLMSAAASADVSAAWKSLKLKKIIFIIVLDI